MEAAPKAKRIIQELVSTEETYQKYLSVCLGVWIKPLLLRAQTAGCSISLEDAKILASNMEELASKISPLLAALQDRLQHYNPNTTTIGDLFQNVDWLELYTEYVCNYHAQIQKVGELVSKADFPSAQDNAAVDERLSIASYLVMPVARVPRYLLLLTELLRSTPDNHPDYPLLMAGIAELREEADKINDRFKRQEEEMANSHNKRH